MKWPSCDIQGDLKPVLWLIRSSGKWSLRSQSKGAKGCFPIDSCTTGSLLPQPAVSPPAGQWKRRRWKGASTVSSDWGRGFDCKNVNTEPQPECELCIFLWCNQQSKHWAAKTLKTAAEVPMLALCCASFKTPYKMPCQCYALFSTTSRVAGM